MALAAFRGRTARRRRPWFLPGSVTLAFVVLGGLMLWTDRLLLADGGSGSPLGFGGGAAAASDILSTIAGSLITVAGLAFSLTIVTIQLVSTQFTPRVVGQFLQDRFNQVAVGFFAGVFTYCIIVQRSVRAPGESTAGVGFVPGLSVNMGILLGLISVQVLVVFIFRVGRSVDVADIATDLGRGTRRSLDELYPAPFGSDTRTAADGAELVLRWRAGAAPVLVRSGQSGYLEEVRLAALCDLAEARVHVLICPGDFLTRQTVVAEVWSDQPVEDRVAGCLTVTSQRSMNQDAEFGLRQLTDIALRAISPGVNDPTTAVMCIGHLQDLLEQLAGRQQPPAVVEQGGTTVVLHRRSFADYLQSSVLEIGRYASTDARVACALLELLERVALTAAAAAAQERLSVLETMIQAVSDPALADARTEADRELLRRGRKAAEAALRGRVAVSSPTAR